MRPYDSNNATRPYQSNNTSSNRSSGIFSLSSNQDIHEFNNGSEKIEKNGSMGSLKGIRQKSKRSAKNNNRQQYDYSEQEQNRQIEQFMRKVHFLLDLKNDEPITLEQLYLLLQQRVYSNQITHSLQKLEQLCSKITKIKKNNREMAKWVGMLGVRMQGITKDRQSKKDTKNIKIPNNEFIKIGQNGKDKINQDLNLSMENKRKTNATTESSQYYRYQPTPIKPKFNPFDQLEQQNDQQEILSSYRHKNKINVKSSVDQRQVKGSYEEYCQKNREYEKRIQSMLQQLGRVRQTMKNREKNSGVRLIKGHTQDKASGNEQNHKNMKIDHKNQHQNQKPLLLHKEISFSNIQQTNNSSTHHTIDQASQHQVKNQYKTQFTQKLTHHQKQNHDGKRQYSGHKNINPTKISSKNQNAELLNRAQEVFQKLEKLKEQVSRQLDVKPTQKIQNQKTPNILPMKPEYNHYQLRKEQYQARQIQNQAKQLSPSLSVNNSSNLHKLVDESQTFKQDYHNQRQSLPRQSFPMLRQKKKSLLDEMKNVQSKMIISQHNISPKNTTQQGFKQENTQNGQSIDENKNEVSNSQKQIIISYVNTYGNSQSHSYGTGKTSSQNQSKPYLRTLEQQQIDHNTSIMGKAGVRRPVGKIVNSSISQQKRSKANVNSMRSQTIGLNKGDENVMGDTTNKSIINKIGSSSNNSSNSNINNQANMTTLNLPQNSLRTPNSYKVVRTSSYSNIPIPIYPNPSAQIISPTLRPHHYMSKNVQVSYQSTPIKPLIQQTRRQSDYFNSNKRTTQIESGRTSLNSNSIGFQLNRNLSMSNLNQRFIIQPNLQPDNRHKISNQENLVLGNHAYIRQQENRQLGGKRLSRNNSQQLRTAIQNNSSYIPLIQTPNVPTQNPSRPSLNPQIPLIPQQNPSRNVSFHQPLISPPHKQSFHNPFQQMLSSSSAFYHMPPNQQPQRQQSVRNNSIVVNNNESMVGSRQSSKRKSKGLGIVAKQLNIS